MRQSKLTKLKIRLVQASILVVVLIATGAVSGQDAADGEAAFNSNCKMCHTIGGGDGTGPDLKDINSKYSFDELVSFLSDPSTFGVTSMPGYEHLGTGTLEAIAIYMGASPETVTEDPPAEPEESTEPEPEEAEIHPGEAAFNTSCAGCHSFGGGAKMGPDLYGMGDLYGYDDLIALIKDPAAFGVSMPPFASLGDQTIKDIVDYLGVNPGHTVQAVEEEPAEEPSEEIEEVEEQPAGPDGQAAYNQNCKGCHSIGGGAGVGPDLENIGNNYGYNDLVSLIKNPGSFGILMPPYASLGDETVKAIVRYLGVNPGHTVERTEEEPEDEPDLSEGKSLFDQYCSECHTIGAGPTAAFDLSDIGAQYGYDELVDFISDPAHTGLISMPSHENLGRETIQKIVQYLGVQPGHVPAGSTGGPADLSVGEAAFEEHCFGCHTIGGGDGVGPDLADMGNIYGYQDLVAFMINPNEFGVMMMPSYGHLGRDTIEAIVQYLGVQPGHTVTGAPSRGGGSSQLAGSPESIYFEDKIPAPWIDQPLGKVNEEEGEALLRYEGLDSSGHKHPAPTVDNPPQEPQTDMMAPGKSKTGALLRYMPAVILILGGLLTVWYKSWERGQTGL
ncbi:MAG TPA: c-type cytochrome [bacterium]|jgi:mono/diheme cytochrome c family protein